MELPAGAAAPDATAGVAAAPGAAEAASAGFAVSAAVAAGLGAGASAGFAAVAPGAAVSAVGAAGAGAVAGFSPQALKPAVSKAATRSEYFMEISFNGEMVEKLSANHADPARLRETSRTVTSSMCVLLRRTLTYVNNAPNRHACNEGALRLI
jgi:hypothetical protein